MSSSTSHPPSSSLFEKTMRRLTDDGIFQQKNAIAIGDQNVTYSPVASYTHLRGNREAQDKAYHDLFVQIDEYSSLIAEALYDCSDLQDELLIILEKAKDRLRHMDEPDADRPWLLSRAQFEVRRVHVEIAREQRSRIESRRMLFFVPLAFVFYIGTIIVFVLGVEAWVAEDGVQHLVREGVIKGLGVPPHIIVWSALGSVAAMLYRFYAIPRRTMSEELNWLFARPLIGIIMGSLAYLTVISGLFIFGHGPGTAAQGPSNQPLLWVIAFVAGFSDRFFEAIIGSITKYVPAADLPQSTSETVEHPKNTSAVETIQVNAVRIAQELDMPDEATNSETAAPVQETASAPGLDATPDESIKE